MSEWSGSYQRFTADQHSPSTRPHNSYLNKVVVNGRNLTNHKRNIVDRESNKSVNLVNARTLYDREPNAMVNTDGTAGGQFLSGVGTPQGGSFFSDFGKGFMSVINPVAKIAAKVAPLAPLIL